MKPIRLRSKFRIPKLTSSTIVPMLFPISHISLGLRLQSGQASTPPVVQVSCPSTVGYDLWWSKLLSPYYSELAVEFFLSFSSCGPHRWSRRCVICIFFSRTVLLPTRTLAAHDFSLSVSVCVSLLSLCSLSVSLRQWRWRPVLAATHVAGCEKRCSRISDTEL